MSHPNPADQSGSSLPLWLQPAVSRRMLICIFTGFSSGLPLFFILNLLPAWLRSEGVDLKTIAFLSLAQLPFTLKFLWAPFMDSVRLPFLGRRRGWMLVTQLALLLAFFAYSLLDARTDMHQIAVLTLVLALLAANQDIVIDAFRREILPDIELGLGNAVHVNAYRIAGLVPGSLSLILAERLSWPQVFIITALFMLPGLFMTLVLAREPKVAAPRITTLEDTFVAPFKDFFGRQSLQRALLVMLFIVLYKLGDSMATALATPFYLDMGFSKQDIGLIAKNAALWPAVIFGILGGIWMFKLGINRALWLFGLVQIITIPGFAILAAMGPFEVITAAEKGLLAAVIAAEATGTGLGTAAFIAFIARETNPAFSATQLALLTSLSAIPRTSINASVGWIIEQIGYVNFFGLCFVLAIPGMLLLFWVAPWNGDQPAQQTPALPS